MRTNKNRKENDAFDRLVGQKLIDYEVPIKLDDDWLVLEKRIRTNKRRKAILIWMSRGVAALLVLLALIIGINRDKDLPIQVISEQQAVLPLKDPSEPTLNDRLNSLQENQPDQREEEGTSMRAQQSITLSKQEINNTHATRQQPKTTETVALPSKAVATIYDSINDQLSNNRLRESLAEAGSTTSTKESVDTTKGNSYEDEEKLWREISKTPPVRSTSAKWLATLGFGGGLIAQNDQYMSSVRPSSMAANPTISTFSATMQKMNRNLWDDCDDADYGVPLSFGLTLRKNINKRWALESGLIYTYLSTTFTWDKPWAKYSVKQELHYIGVPVSVVWYAWNKPNWNIYIAGGGMVEKGVRASSRKQEYFGTATLSDVGSNRIDGLQYSINSSVGITYRLYKGIGIYLEPRISYFFENGQPLSIRTDWPVTVGATAGFRYEF